ncbi:hypothetical protein QYF36_021604 [Acer negundo]|nr:hypothetical protein QYF36_021604 [Acer negundo]
MKKGGWNCPEAEGPKKVDMDEEEVQKGDWNCAQCGFLNFAKNKKCLRCCNSQSERKLNRGDWECSSCDYLNFRRIKPALNATVNAQKHRQHNRKSKREVIILVY